MNLNEHLNVATLSALDRSGALTWKTDVQFGQTSSIAESGTPTPCFLTAVYEQNYTAECIAVKYRQIFVSSPSVLFLRHLKPSLQTAWDNSFPTG